MMSIQSDMPAEKRAFSALLALSLGLHITLSGAALLFNSSNAPLPHLQSITVEIKCTDFPAKEVKADVKKLSAPQPAPLEKKCVTAGSSSPAVPLQQADIQPLAKKEEMPLPLQAKTSVAAPPLAAISRLPATVQPKALLQQTTTAPGNAAPVAPQPNSVGKEYTSKVRELIDQQKEYPLLARRIGAEGTVYIKFILARDGRLKQAEVSRSSGRRILDKAAIDAVTRVNRFPAVPDDMVGPDLNFELPLAFKIAGN